MEKNLFRYISIGKCSLEKEKFNPIKNIPYFSKPDGGLWGSLYQPKDHYISSWFQLKSANCRPSLLNDDAILFNLKSNATICEINSISDLKKLVGQVGITKDPIFEQLHLNSIKNYPDFEKASEQFDAIYLSKEGLRNVGSAERFISEDGWNLIGWDVESILVMNFDCIKNWKYLDLKSLKKN